MGIVLIGASGHGKVCAEIAELTGYNGIRFLDDNRELTECGGHPVVGAQDDFRKYMGDGTAFFVSIGNSQTRKRIQTEIEAAGGRVATLVHPKSTISKDVKIGDGTAIMAGAVVNAGTTIGRGAIVNTSSSIDHDCVIGDYSHVAVGAHICGTVAIGTGVWIGAGATISNNLSICDGCMVGAGAVVIHDITISDKYIGVPAKRHEILLGGGKLSRKTKTSYSCGMVA